jgi:hypothetical protein
MKKIIITALMMMCANLFALVIHNPDGTTTYITQDPSGAARVDNGDGSTSFITDY